MFDWYAVREIRSLSLTLSHRLSVIFVLFVSINRSLYAGNYSCSSIRPLS